MTPTPVLRAVLLGASNLTSALPALVDELRAAAGGPVEVLAACGRARSYGTWSSYWGIRQLPAITGCGLWSALAARPALPTVALVTDVGNDLGYGETAATINAWVDSCLARLAGVNAATVCTLLPLARLERLSAFSYYAARTILFPGLTVPRPLMIERARELDGGLRRLAAKHAAAVVEPELSWYGLDPIHPKPARRRELWRRVLAAWPLPGSPFPRRRRRVALPLCGQEHLRLFHRDLRNPQPVCRLADGSTVALF